MSEYEIAGIMCVAILGTWGVAYISSWVVQLSWAWIDDSEVSENNWLVDKVPKLSNWKYPVYNGFGDDLENRGFSVFGYAKDIKFKKKSVHGLKHGVDYIYCFEVNFYKMIVILFTSVSPLLVLVSIKLYPLVIGICTLMLVGYLARFSRRTKKLFDKHVVDKNAHKETNQKEVNNETSK